MIGEQGKGYPWGSNDNDEFDYFSLVDKNAYCLGLYNTFKYYYFKNLSSIDLEIF